MQELKGAEPAIDAAAALCSTLDGVFEALRGLLSTASTTPHFPAGKAATAIARESSAQYLKVQKLAKMHKHGTESRAEMAKAWGRLQPRLGQESAAATAPEPSFSQAQLDEAKAAAATEAGAFWTRLQTNMLCCGEYLQAAA